MFPKGTPREQGPGFFVRWKADKLFHPLLFLFSSFRETACRYRDRHAVFVLRSVCGTRGRYRHYSGKNRPAQGGGWGQKHMFVSNIAALPQKTKTAPPGRERLSLLARMGRAFAWPRVVEVTGLEPAASWSQTRRATSCATPRGHFSL